MSSTARETAENWLDARSACDLERMRGLTDEQATWDSPVLGMLRGREAVLDQVRAGFVDTDDFATELLSLHVRGKQAVAVIRNSGQREGEELDSLQSMFIRVEEGLVAEVKIAVDDPEAVEAFWSA